MRINLKNIDQSSLCDRYQTINNFDLINYYQLNNFSALKITWLDTFSDYARYQLDVYNLYVDDQYEIINCELKLNFTLNFDFKLFCDAYVNYWKNDDIDIIKPLVYSYHNLPLAIDGFNYLVVFFFKNIYYLLNESVFFCRKIANTILLSFRKPKNFNNELLLNIIDNFLNAIYEMVKNTSARYNYDIQPPTGLNKINMKTWFENIAKKNKYKKIK